MNGIRKWAAALAVAFAASAFAQGAQEDPGSLGERMRRARERKAGQATPAPAPQRQGQAAPQGQGQGQTAQLNDEQKRALGTIHATTLVSVHAGELASQRGASQEVKDLGRRISQEHRQVDLELSKLASARGVDLNALGEGENRQQLEAQLRQLETKNGEEFDREFVSFLTKNGNAFVDAAKRARDVTPGKDAELKKFLDDAENKEEERLTQARQLKSQRQARTPPAR